MALNSLVSLLAALLYIMAVNIVTDRWMDRWMDRHYNPHCTCVLRVKYCILSESKRNFEASSEKSIPVLGANVLFRRFCVWVEREIWEMTGKYSGVLPGPTYIYHTCAS